ncbi:hypothetical protein LCGC14_1432080 [marine sediment metagenome]|uniref:Uncharacterized protein n=1 Tax=marine sediment metagenome TaxID=412755 RepID=A0A0F9M3V1_9ZZZZ
MNTECPRIFIFVSHRCCETPWAIALRGHFLILAIDRLKPRIPTRARNIMKPIAGMRANDNPKPIGRVRAMTDLKPKRKVRAIFSLKPIKIMREPAIK